MGLKVRWIDALRMFEIAEKPAKGLWGDRIRLKKGDHISGAAGRSFHELASVESCERLLRQRPNEFFVERKIDEKSWWTEPSNAPGFRLTKLRHNTELGSSLGMRGKIMNFTPFSANDEEDGQQNSANIGQTPSEIHAAITTRGFLLDEVSREPRPETLLIPVFLSTKKSFFKESSKIMKFF